MFTRRQGLMGAGAVALAVNASAVAKAQSAQTIGRSATEIASDELFWRSIARSYRLDDRWIILNGGGNNPHPLAVTGALGRYNELSSTAPRPHNYVLWNQMKEHKTRLASLMKCAPEELAITRNTTEGLNIVGWGLDLQPSDEIILSDVDDHYAGKVFEQRAMRHGVSLKRVQLPVEPSAAQTIGAFEAAMTAKTKLVVASHVVDGLGYVLPIRELSDLAHERGAQLLCDGALGFGQIPVNMRELGCDYYATSLHKWLNAPLGTGALYVRRDRIEALWPLYGTRRAPDDITKFEDIGTRSGPTLAAIGQAIDFYEEIGPHRKAERVRHLLSLIMRDLEGVERVRVITEPDESKRTGLARVSIEGVTGRDLTRMLREDHAIFTYGNWPGPIDGVYVSPNIFNSAEDMLAFSGAIKEIAADA